MNKLRSQEYPESSSTSFLEYEKSFVESIKSGTSKYPITLFGRMQEFNGDFVGWIPDKNDPQFWLEDNLLDEETTKVADNFSKILTEKEPFYAYNFPPRGPAGIFPWIFAFLVEYGLGKGLDYLIEKLKKKELIEEGNKISLDWGKNNGDSLGKIEISFTDGSKVVIENYPHAVERITIDQIKRVEKAIEGKKEVIVLYDAWGRISASIKNEYGRSINLEL